MHRFVVVMGAACAASACAMIVGLDDPQELGASDGGGDANVANDVTTPSDGDVGNDGGALGDADADAGRVCTGTVLKVDSFDNRTTDAAAGWNQDNAGDSGIIDIVDGGLHVYVGPTTTGVNARRQLSVTKGMAPQRMCATFSVRIVKPTNLMAYFDPGSTNFGFIAARGVVNDASVTFFDGVGINSKGPYAHVSRPADESATQLAVPIDGKWRVYLNADFAANTLTVAINDKETTLTNMRPAFPTANASFEIGIRNLGQVPEAEAYFDDVVVTAD